MSDKKKALIVQGGWDGHEPELVSARFKRILEEEGLEVELYDDLAQAFGDPEKLMGALEDAGIPVDELMGMIMGGNIDFGGDESVTEAPNYDDDFDYDFEDDFDYDYDEDAKNEASENVEYFEFAA